MNVLRNSMKLSLRKARKLTAQKFDEKELVTFQEDINGKDIERFKKHFQQALFWMEKACA
jgi:hypothetical protein